MSAERLTAMYQCRYCTDPARWLALTKDGYTDVCDAHRVGAGVTA